MRGKRTETLCTSGMGGTPFFTDVVRGALAWTEAITLKRVVMSPMNHTRLRNSNLQTRNWSISRGQLSPLTVGIAWPSRFGQLREVINPQLVR